MTIDDMEQDLLASYRELHDWLSEHVAEAGVLENVAPDLHRQLVHKLMEVNKDNEQLRAALEAEGA